MGTVNQTEELIPEVENRKEFKELTSEELKRGYSFNEITRMFTCIFCGEAYEEGLIYSVSGKLMTAEKAAASHITEAHGGSTNELILLDKQISGLSETQKTLLRCMNKKMEIKEISEVMGISAATVRSHKFNLQKSKREAKILLAIIENIESEAKTPVVKHTEEKDLGQESREESELIFNLNSLHPFFTQVKYR